jgi:hypothetical protein
LVSSSMRLGIPFIAPRQLGAVESNPGRQFLPSVAWRTGHCPVRISFLIWRSRPLALGSRWRTGQSDAPSRPLARPRVLRRSHSRPLARATVGSPDSPVNYSCTPLIYSRERQVRLSQPGTPDTVRCTTRHCPVHHRTVRCTQTELTLVEQSHLISNSIFPVSST